MKRIKMIIIKCNSFTSSMDDLSLAVNNSGIGGYLGDAFLNHLCYADDICLISLSFDNVVRYYIVYSMYGFITFVCIFIFVGLCYNENNSFLKIILFSYLYE